MTKPGKTPKKKTKEKSPQRTEESEYPAMDQDEFNRLFQNAIEQSQAQLQQKYEWNVRVSRWEPPQLWEDRIGIKEIKREKEVS